MNILIVAATDLEIQPAVEYLRTQDFEGGKFRCEVLITGVGAVATTYHLTRYLASKNPDFIIQAGIAGSFRREIALGTVLYVEEETFGDMGVVETGAFKDLFDLGLVNENDLPFRGKSLKNPFSHLVRSSQLPAAKSIGINEITTQSERIDELLKKYNPDIESMEGAAFHYACLHENIPFVQIRAVSNYVGERDKSKWDIKAAVNNLNEKLIKIIYTQADGRSTYNHR